MIPGIVAGNPVSGGGGGPTQSFAFNPSDKHDNITLSDSDKTASTTSGSGHFYAMCTNPKNSGKWMFEFAIDSMPPSTGNIGIGMAESPAALNTASHVNPQVDSGFDWWVRKSGALVRFYYGGSGSAYDGLSPAASYLFDTGDRVTVTVDFNTEEVNVYRNGTLIYTKTVTSINAETYSYAPVVKLWGTATPATVSIPSDILYPVTGFTPWA